MGEASTIALLGALFTLFAAVLATLVNFYRERSEKQKWQRTVELEERRFSHEKSRWALELNSLRETELYKLRLQVYPEVFAALASLSQYNIHDFDHNSALALSQKLNEWGYNRVGLCMLPETRDALFVLRDYCLAFAKGQIRGIEDIIPPRTTLIELIRRDLSHDYSQRRDFKSLLEVNREQLQRILDQQT